MAATMWLRLSGTAARLTPYSQPHFTEVKGGRTASLVKLAKITLSTTTDYIYQHLRKFDVDDARAIFPSTDKPQHISPAGMSIAVAAKGGVAGAFKLGLCDEKEFYTLTVPSLDLSALIFLYQKMELHPPRRVLIDSCFLIDATDHKKITQETENELMARLYGNYIPCITRCVIAEIWKLQTHPSALRIAIDIARFERLVCTHSGDYSDYCFISRVAEREFKVVATHDNELKETILNKRGTIMYIKGSKLALED